MASMSISTALAAAQPFVIGIGLPLVAVIGGITLPIQMQQASIIGALSSKIDSLKDGQARIESASSGLLAELRKVEDRLAERDPDPTKLFSMASGFPENSLRAATVAYHDGTLFVLPKTQEFSDAMLKSGFKLEQLSPTISGFKVIIKTESITDPEKEPKTK